MKSLTDITGQVFVRLTALEPSKKKYFWKCSCECGNKIEVSIYSLLDGNTKSCGCYQKIYPAKKTHGMSNSIEYKTWAHIKSRCLNKNNKDYKHYGARGITICDSWKNSFENFYNDMGKRPSEKHSIERIDNNKGYSKENCRWATMQEQNQNTSQTVFLIYKGEKKSRADWCRIFNIKQTTLISRIEKLKWSVEKALTVPSRGKNVRTKTLSKNCNIRNI